MDSTGRKSLGRRIFDIYVQGICVEKDFDIKRVAGGVPRTAVQREYMAQVSENYLEIHLFWAGKGTCCIPTDGTYGPLISAISATPDFEPTIRPPRGRNPMTKKNRAGIFVGVVVVFLLLLALFFIIQTRRRPQIDDDELLGIDVRPYTYSYAELRAATEGFNPANKLVKGGF